MSITLPSTLVELRRKIKCGAIDTAQAIESQKLAIAADELHSVVSFFGDAEITPEQSLDEHAKPLSGVGLAHKDMFFLPDYTPKCGAKIKVRFDSKNTPLIERLEHAGGITLGMLAMAEFAAGITGQNPNYPCLINPLGERLAVGGSSSGSAVAVSAGLCYGSLGTDTAGSVRVPAATCGVFGLKPTEGVLETRGAFPLAPSLDTVGILTRSALDAAVIFAAALTVEKRQKILPQFDEVVNELGGIAEPRHLPKKDWKLAVVLEHPKAGFSANVELCDAVISIVKQFSSDPVRHKLPLINGQTMMNNASLILHVESAAVHYKNLRENGISLNSITRATTLPGLAIPGVWYRLAHSKRMTLRAQFLSNYFRNADIVLTPTLPNGVPDWDEVYIGSKHFKAQKLLAMFSWMSFVNYLGLPAVTFPIGQDKNGLPLSVQAIGRPGSESSLLAFAYAVEQRLYGKCGFRK